MRKLEPLIARGLAAAVYTQTSDVESEVNGVMSYERAIIKLDSAVALVPRKLRSVLPSSRREPQIWRYTSKKPASGWQKPDFDDSG